MYRVMIVEDEMLVRIGLKSSVEWSKFGMEVAADLPDGQAAWDYYQREKPDVIITDIRMPRMDGMALIANVRKRDKDARIVVLTCLEEFDLARKAMALGVSNYILKLTMTSEEIEGVLHDIRQELDRQEGRTAAAAADTVRSPGSLDLVKEKMFKDFLFYNIFSAEEFGRFAERNGLRLSPSRLVVCVMEVDRYARLRDKFKDDHGQLIKLTLLNILSEIATSSKRGEAFSIEETRYALVLPFGEVASEQAVMQETHGILSRIQEAIHTYFNGSVSFGISAVRSGYEALPKLYAEATRALNRKFIAGPGKLHREGQPPEDAGVRERLEKLRGATAIRELISPHKRKEYDAYLEFFEREFDGDRKSVEAMLHRFAQWIDEQIGEDGGDDRSRIVSTAERLEENDTLPDGLDFVIGHLNDAARQARERLQLSGEISKAIAYIKQHYTDNISLQSVASYVGLSVSYLSNLFKKELHISFIDYLNRYRIERAKELLAGTSLKSYDIAVEVGFSPEYTYFSKVFKKVTGLNPNEYRRQVQDGAHGEP